MFRCILAVVGEAVLAATGCQIQRRLFMPTSGQLVDLHLVTAEEDLDALERGRAIAVIDCSGCHRQYWPAEYTPGEWKRIIRVMSRRASLSREESADVGAYFRAVSSAALQSAVVGKPQQ